MGQHVMHTLPPSSLTMQEKKPPNKGGKRSQMGGGVWDSHRPPSTTPREWEGVGSRRHICAILPLRQLWGAMTGYVVAPCPPSPLVLTKNPGNDDDQVVVVIPAPLSPYSLPSSILPHHSHLLPFPFGSDVVVVALDMGSVIIVGRW